jgi:hydrogenase nickel incorporation protein HypA/HybF
VHELALADAVVQGVAEKTGDAKVVRVRLIVGKWTAVVPDALRFAFEICTRGTTLDGATLELKEIAAEASCRACGARFCVDDSLALCDCGSADLIVDGGGELRIDEVEVA